MSQTLFSTLHKTIEVDGLEIFYREAGPEDAPTILLLHGFPTSSHMFRNLILVYGFDWTIDEVADLLSVSRSTVQTHTERALARLRDKLGVEL